MMIILVANVVPGHRNRNIFTLCLPLDGADFEPSGNMIDGGVRMGKDYSR